MNIVLQKFVSMALAMDMTVSQPGCYVAKRARTEIRLYITDTGNTIIIFYDKKVVLTLSEELFKWTKLSIIKGRLYYEDQLLK